MAEQRSVYFKEHHRVLTNPGMGFKTFQRFNGDLLNEGTGWTEGYPIEYQNRDTLVTPMHPMCSLAYFRIYWRFIQPQEDRFEWSVIDDALKAAREHGQTLYLRVAPYGSSGEQQDDVPDWFRKRVGPRPDNIHNFWRVDHEDPAYAQAWGNFVRALAERYNGHPDLECVDVSLLGFWGEGEGTASLEQETRIALLDPYLKGFTDTLMVLQMTDYKTTQYALQHCDHMGWRVDCLGDMRGVDGKSWCHMLDLYPFDVFDCGLQDAWKTGPVSLECCWVMQHWLDQGWDIDYIIDQSLRWHINNYNSKSSRVPPEWQPQVDAWLKKMGYRFVPRKLMYDGCAAAGGQMGFRSLWTNQGVAPAYYRYPLAFRLTGAGGQFVIKSDLDMRKLLPGDGLVNGAITLPKDIPAGEYRLEMALFGRTEDTPSVHLAVEGEQPDGWTPLSTLQVTQG